MESQEKWELGIVRDRHRWLKLTPKQVRAVWEIEQMDNQLLLADHKEIFSFWEEMDRDWDRWHAILKPDQFKLWAGDHKKHQREHEQQLIRGDAGNLKDVEFHQVYMDWLRKTFLPGFHKAVGMDGIWMRIRLQDKIDYLRAEYRTHILRRKSNAIISHYRYCRRLQPNALRLALLRNELLNLLPDYTSFVRQADEGVKAVGGLLLEKQRFMFAQKGELILEKIKPMYAYHKVLRKKFFGDETPNDGWQVVIENKSDLTPAEQNWMNYLLMDTAPATVLDLHRL
jgi:hypothetical protein